MIIQMPSLGNHGRLGNQIFQFFFLKILEEKLGCEIRYPSWSGTHMFGIAPSAPIELVKTTLNLDDSDNSGKRNTGPDEDFDIICREISVADRAIVDITGYFQYHTSYLRPHAGIFSRSFSLAPALADQLATALAVINPEARQIIGIHIRRGDFLTLNGSRAFWAHSFDSVFQAIDDLICSSLYDILIYLASDDVDACAAEFDRRGMPFATSTNLFRAADDYGKLLCDFWMLTQADYLLTSNSSFSVAAAMRNEKARIFLRPSPKEDRMLPFDPWNTHVLLRKA